MPDFLFFVRKLNTLTAWYNIQRVRPLDCLRTVYIMQNLQPQAPVNMLATARTVFAFPTPNLSPGTSAYQVMQLSMTAAFTGGSEVSSPCP